MWKSFLSYAALVIFKVEDFFDTPNESTKHSHGWRY